MASNLFDLVSRAKAHAKANQYATRAAQRLEDTVNGYMDGRVSKWKVDQEIRAFEQLAGEHALRNQQRSQQMQRQGIGRKAAEWLNTVTGKMGGIGRVIQKIFEGRDEGFTQDQVRSAQKLIQHFDVQEISNRDADYEHQITAAIQSLEDHNWSIDATMGTLAQSTPSRHLEDLVPPDRYKGSKHQQARRGVKDDANIPRLSKKYMTPNSSNVYMFQYDYLTSTCYVQYKAPQINTAAVTNYQSAGGMRAMAGDMGKTIIGKTNDPGPLYAYYDVPNKVFQTLVQAITNSAGKAVWDELRIRGSVHGHQFRYGLVSGVMVPGEGGELANYVPRRAVKGGFKSRSVRTIGAGRGRYVSSTLPQDMRGHRTILAMRHRPSPPNRGRQPPPNRGR
jgi:hypothetical protein